MIISAITLPENFPVTPQSNPRAARPNPFPDCREGRARRIKQLLLDLAQEESDPSLKSAIRQTADFFRENFFGLTEKKIRSRIVEVLEDYFDGEQYNALEIDNISELTGIKPEILLPVLEKMIRCGIVLEGRRKRFNELGNHYNRIYCLARARK